MFSNFVPNLCGKIKMNSRGVQSEWVWTLESPQKCSCADTTRKQKKLIRTVSVRVFDVCVTKLHIYRVKVSFLHDNQVPHPKYQCFCSVISVRLRKAQANEVPLCFRCVASLRTHPHMYHQRYTPSRIHWQMNVKGAVLLSSMHCATIT
jgi:hypothetical protein